MRDAFLLDSLVLILIWGTSAAAWNVAGGYAGQISLGHSAFFGLGAYAAALLGTRWELSPWLGLAVGALVAMAIGLVIGYLSNRLRGPYFVLATIAFSQVLLIVGSRWRGFTAGSEGIPGPVPARVLDPRHRGQAGLGLDRAGARGARLPRRSSTSSGRAAATSSRRCARTRTPRSRSACRRGG